MWNGTLVAIFICRKIFSASKVMFGNWLRWWFRFGLYRVSKRKLTNRQPDLKIKLLSSPNSQRIYSGRYWIEIFSLVNCRSCWQKSNCKYKIAECFIFYIWFMITVQLLLLYGDFFIDLEITFGICVNVLSFMVR